MRLPSTAPRVPRVVQSIGGQEEHHRKLDFKAELIALLERHEIEYDEGSLNFGRDLA
jgi:hypothetical protein